MKQALAEYTSSVLTKMAGFYVTTMSNYFCHMPEAPQELLRKESN